MIRLSARPFLAVYVVWHPSFVEGEDLSAALFNHFRRDLFSNVAGGTGLSVVFRSTPLPGKQLPLGIDLDEAETSAVVVLLDGHLTGDPTWMIYVDDLVTRARSGGLRARVFPVAMDSAAYNITGSTKEVSYVRWDSWFGDASADRVRRLTTQLAYEFCRMLRHYLESLKHPAEAESELAKYLRKVSVFLSHSKHDSYGEQIAKRIRDSIHQETGLASFFDVRDIPAGLPFADVLMHTFA